VSVVVWTSNMADVATTITVDPMKVAFLLISTYQALQDATKAAYYC
jgi:hypothetical protein